jgi:hypothetical protein|tara:strand:- start:5012 stop:5209 length:198 start_codon:yes stop_codon:yes gene_type:complete
MKYILVFLLFTGCAELLMISSTTGVIVSQAPLIKAYNGADMLTIMSTKQDIKTTIYKKLKTSKKD